MLNFFRIEKDGCTQGKKVALLLFNDLAKAGQAAFSIVDIGSSVGIVACTTCIAGTKLFL